MNIMNFIPFYKYRQGMKILDKEDADSLLVRSGQYPKHIEPPVDMEYNRETRDMEAFFNIVKYAKYHKMDGVFKKFPHLQLKLDEMTANNAFLAEYADRLYERLDTYNRMSPSEQFQKDLKITFRRSIYGTVAILIMLGLLIGLGLPKIFVMNADRQFSNGNYVEAYKSYDNAPGIYAERMKELSKMNIYIQEHEFDEAKKVAESLTGLTISGKYPTDQLVNHVYYEKAQYYKSKKIWHESAVAYTQSSDYLDSQKQLIDVGHKAYDQLLEDKNWKRIIEIFVYLVGYQDSEEIMLQAMEQYYQEGLLLYNNGDFKESHKVFEFLSKYNYKNSNTMTMETQYQDALTFYSNQQFDEAISILEKITTYKDSNALLKESYYSMAILHVVSEPREALQYLLKAYNYKEANTLLQSGSIIPYGDWKVTEVNSSAINATSLIFNLENQVVLSDKTIPEIASQFDVLIPYQFEAGKFVNGQHFFEVIEVMSINKIKIKADNLTLTLVRTKPISSLVRTRGSVGLSDMIRSYFKPEQKNKNTNTENTDSELFEESEEKDELSLDEPSPETSTSVEESSTSTETENSSNTESETSSSEDDENKYEL